MRKDIWLKAASVVLAVAMWFTVISRGQTEVSIQAPVVLENVPEDLVVSDEGTRSLVVDIRGHERFIRGLDPSDVSVTLNLGGIRKGRNTISVSEEDVRLPAQLKVVDIRPSTIGLVAEESLSVTVPVFAVVTGSPQEGYSVKGVGVSPAEVRLKGARSRLRRVKYVNTEPVDISLATADVVREVGLEKAAQGVTAEEQVATVHVGIEKEKR